MIQMLLPAKPWKAPRKKFRGKRRYFKRVFREANDYLPSLGPNDWYDMWHYHADWWGYGNLSWKYRVKQIEAYCIIYRKFVDGLRHFNKPYQLFIYIDRDDAAQDAVYLNTPSPGAEFPFKWTGAHWGIPMFEEYFSKALSPYSIRSGQLDEEGSRYFCVYSPKIGESLE